jgi:hypothetical protein
MSLNWNRIHQVTWSVYNLSFVAAAALWRRCLRKTTFIAIVGSIGKSTATKCLYKILSSQFPCITNEDTVALVFTAVIARAEVKYGPRAYPFSLLEARHMAQNIALTCTKHGIGACPVGGFVNDSVAKIIDLTEHETPIYVYALGSLSA